MGARETNTDNAKHGRPLTKAEASVPMPIWPSMGAWAARDGGVVQQSEMSDVAEDYNRGQRWQPGMDSDADFDND